MSFTRLNLHKDLLEQIQKKGFTSPSEIQSTTIPVALSGKDIIACAKTGSGKTLAFLLPILHHFLEQFGNSGREESYPYVLILAPTRELALQISEEANWLSQGNKIRVLPIFGGVDYEKQRAKLNKGVDIIVATPGRLMDYMRSGEIDISHVERFVLDEADRMLDMGFIDDVKYIVEKTSNKRKTYLFSATMDYNAVYAIWKWMKDPEEFLINPELIDHSKIQQGVLHLGKDEKIPYLIQMLEVSNLEPIIVFTNSRQFVEVLVQNLSYHNIPSRGLSSVVTQNKRLKVLEDFKEHRFKVLVATDVASRGLHIEDVQLVVNYDIPQDPESYVHRIGRTARAGKSGQAISICSEMDYDSFGKLERYLKYKIPSIAPEDRFIENLSFVRLVKTQKYATEKNDYRKKESRPQPHHKKSTSQNFKKSKPARANQQKPGLRPKQAYKKQSYKKGAAIEQEAQPISIKDVAQIISVRKPKKTLLGHIKSFFGIKSGKPVQISERTLAHLEKEATEKRRISKKGQADSGKKYNRNKPRQGKKRRPKFKNQNRP